MHLARATGLAVVLGSLLAATDALAQDPTATPAPAQTPAPAAATRPMVVVHLDADPSVNLEMDNGHDDWQVMCHAPCDRPVPASEIYRVNGLGIRTSNTFQLDTGSRITVHVDATSSAGRAGAVVVTVIGGVGLVPVLGVTALLVGGELLGAILGCPLVAAFETDKTKQSSAYSQCLGDIGTFFGKGYAEPYVWIPAVAGVALLTTGIVWLVKTPSSRVTQTPSAAALVLPPVPWTDLPPRLEAVRVPPAPVVQLLDLRF